MYDVVIIGGGPGGSGAVVVDAVLAGELEGGWRMRLFFWRVRVPARLSVVPPISFDPVPSV